MNIDELHELVMKQQEQIDALKQRVIRVELNTGQY